MEKQKEKACPSVFASRYLEYQHQCAKGIGYTAYSTLNSSNSR